MLLHNNSDSALSRRFFNRVWSKGLIFWIIVDFSGWCVADAIGLTFGQG